MSYEDYLMHFGILGMRWGKRNGPPYPLSYRQMNPEQRKLSKKSYEVAESNNKPATKSVKDMTDKELDDAIKRLRNEKTYTELTSSDINQGSEFVKGLLTVFGSVAALTFVKEGATKAGKAGLNWLEKKLKSDDKKVSAKDILEEFKGNPSGLKEAFATENTAEMLAKIRNKG